MAIRKRRMYCLGEMMVGSLPPARMPVDLTQVSSCLSHVNCSAQRQTQQGKTSGLGVESSGACCISVTRKVKLMFYSIPGARSR